MKTLQIGYIVPEFPGQTHTFFWREIAELEKNGIEVNIVSTRKPKSGKSPHGWTEAAEARTIYLSPLNTSFPKLLIYATKKLRKIFSCISMILRADDATQKEKVLLVGSLVYSLKLSMIAESKKWRHLHAHFCYRAADIVLFASKISGTTYSISKHGPDFSIGNQDNKWRHASFGTVITKKMLNELLNLRSESITKNIYVISMGVDTDVFQRYSEYQPYQLKNNFIIFCCARIDPGKGQLDLIHLAKKLLEKDIAFEIRVAGNPSKSGEHYLEAIKKLIDEYNLHDRVIFLGPLSEPKVKAQLEQCHAFLLPSRNEPLGVVYMEAMSMEVPTIANNSGGVPELITHMHDGVLCEPESIDSLATAIEWIINNPISAKSMGKNGRKKIVSQYSSAGNAKKLAKCLKDHASSRGIDSPTINPPNDQNEDARNESATNNREL